MMTSRSDNWRQSNWGDEVSLEYGKALRGYGAVGKVRVYGSNGAIGWTDKPLANGPGVILGRKGAYRGVEYCKNPFFVIDTAYYVVPKTELNMRWLYYAVKHHKLGEIDDGSPIPSTTRAAVYVRDLDVPAPTEQKAIAEVLGALDDKIELNRKTNATLEAMARALFKSWFVDFDPVRAKSEGREPFGMNAETAALFPSRLVPSALSDIPEGWDVKTIGELVTAVGGGTPSTKNPEYWEAGLYAWATPKDMSKLNGPVLFSTERNITDAGVASISSGQLPAGSVLMSSRAPIGYIAISEIPVSINQGFIAVICDKKLPNIFVWQWLHANMDAIKGRANGSTFQEISKANFRPLLCLDPSVNVLNAFQEQVLPLWQKLVINEKESQRLVKTRDYLLPKLISGEIRIPDAENFLEAT